MNDMKLSFTTKEIDRIPAELMVLMYYEHDVPLRGMLGMLDWRLNGRFSRIVKRNMYNGKARELLLMPGEKRLKAKEILVLGLGKKQDFEEAHVNQVLDYFVDTIAKKKAEQVCFSLAPLLSSPFEWRNAVRLLLSKLVDYPFVREVILREPEDCIRDAKRRQLNFGPHVQISFDAI
jgi:hypothetical protein